MFLIIFCVYFSPFDLIILSWSHENFLTFILMSQLQLLTKDEDILWKQLSKNNYCTYFYVLFFFLRQEGSDSNLQLRSRNHTELCLSYCYLLSAPNPLFYTLFVGWGWDSAPHFCFSCRFLLGLCNGGGVFKGNGKAGRGRRDQFFSVAPRGSPGHALAPSTGAPALGAAESGVQFHQHLQSRSLPTRPSSFNNSNFFPFPLSPGGSPGNCFQKPHLCDTFVFCPFSYLIDGFIHNYQFFTLNSLFKQLVWFLLFD